MIDNILGFYELIFILATFLLLCKSRFSPIRTALFSGLVLIFCFAGFIFGTGYLKLDPIVSSALFLTIPSFVLFLFQAEFRGARYVFTFCTADILGLITMTSSLSITLMASLPPWTELVWCTLFSALTIFIVYRVRHHYWEIQEHVTSGWTGMAGLSVLMYATLYFIIGYPAPLRTRQEYLVPVLFVFITFLYVFAFLYLFVANMKKNYDFEQNQELLHVQLELQEAQIAERDLYYKMAYTDALTGLANRAALSNTIEALREKGLEHLSMMAGLSFDLNNLKDTNDTEGHAAGDTLIRDFASILRNIFTGNENIFRMGGDEFWVLQEYDEKEGLAPYMERLNNELSEYNVTHRIPISIAIGTATLDHEYIKAHLDQDCQSCIMSLFSAADKGMYLDKQVKKQQLA